ncbi:MAG: hypothetical protein BMS9Abin05_2751 [Rhodothermia bacterium]|nr:MAG: hypothetical protein BMS9Abin05_2751 [Rhodothermia bacterium]
MIFSIVADWSGSVLGAGSNKLDWMTVIARSGLMTRSI